MLQPASTGHLWTSIQHSSPIFNMYSPFIFAAAVLSLASLTLAKSASCPYNYPAFLNNTANSNGLVLTVISNNPVTNNRVVQVSRQVLQMHQCQDIPADQHSSVLTRTSPAASMPASMPIHPCSSPISPTALSSRRLETSTTSSTTSDPQPT